MNTLKRALLLGFVSFILSMGQAGAQLSSHVDVTLGASVWNYTLFNDEASTSSSFITNFILAVDAPVTVLNSPTGWDFQTDNSSYVFWFNTDPVLPYPHDIAPGNSLDGFTIGSTAVTSTLSDYNLSAWDHSQDAPGPVAAGTVLAPSTPAAIPEASTWQSLGALLLLGGLLAVRRPHRKRG